MNNHFFKEILDIVKKYDSYIDSYIKENYPEDVTLEDFLFYRKYISLFSPCKFYVKPNEYYSEYKDMQFIFIASSRSSKYKFVSDFVNFEIRFNFHAETKISYGIKLFDKITPFKIRKLFSIYLSDLIYLEKLISENNEVKPAIEIEWRKKLNEWNYKTALAESKSVYLKLIKQ